MKLKTAFKVSIFILLHVSITKCHLRSYCSSSPDMDNHLKIASCAKPVEFLSEGQLSSGISTKHPGLLPPWFNSTLFKIGQNFGSKNTINAIAGQALFFLMYSSFPDTQAVLLSTGKTDTIIGAAKRYLMSFLHFKLYYEAVAKDNETISPHILESFHNIRAIHAQVAKNIKTPLAEIKLNHSAKINEEFWNALAKDLQDSNIPLEYRSFPPDFAMINNSNVKPMNHIAMITAQWFLVAPSILFPEETGIFDATEEELWGWIHLWAVVGYGLGMEDEYNIALHPNLAATRIYYKKFFSSYFIPSLFQINLDGKVLWESIFNGFELLGPRFARIARKEHVMIYLLEHLIGIKAHNLRTRLTRTDLAIQDVLLVNGVKMFRYQYIRNLVNGIIKESFNGYFDHKSIAEKAYL